MTCRPCMAVPPPTGDKPAVRGSRSRPYGEREPARPLDCLREQAFPRLSILHEDGADRTVFRRLQNLLLGISLRVNRLGLTVGIELKHVRGKSLAHGIAHTHVVIHPEAQFASHNAS